MANGAQNSTNFISEIGFRWCGFEFEVILRLISNPWPEVIQLKSKNSYNSMKIGVWTEKILKISNLMSVL